VVSRTYQDKHADPGGGEAESGRKDATIAPPHVLLGFLRWAQGAAAFAIILNRSLLAYPQPEIRRLPRRKAPDL